MMRMVRNRRAFASFGLLFALGAAPSLAAAQTGEASAPPTTEEPTNADSYGVVEPAPESTPAPTTPPPTPSPETTATSAPPPPPEEAAATPAATDASHDDDDDGDRTRHFWVDFAAGYTWINMVALDQSGLVPEPQQQRSSGIVGELGVGFQVSVFRAGIAGSYSRYDGFDALTAELDVAIVIPIPIIQPYIEAGIGYGAIRNVTEPSASMPGRVVNVPIHGIAIDVGLGIDIAVSDVVQFGIGAEASFLNLQRQRVTDVGTINNVNFNNPGNSVGLQIHGVGRVTFQF